MKYRAIVIPLIRGVIVASALFVVTLGGPAAAPLQAQGKACVEDAWSDLNDCYMSDSGFLHDAGCKAVFFLDVAGCAAEAKKAMQLL